MAGRTLKDEPPPLTAEEILEFRAFQRRRENWRFVRQVGVMLASGLAATFAALWGAWGPIKEFIKAFAAALK
jgi:hypothetical protein